MNVSTSYVTKLCNVVYKCIVICGFWLGLPQSEPSKFDPFVAACTPAHTYFAYTIRPKCLAAT